ncbi:MAG: outer membrane protein assembly factor BamD [Opitutales bacterium]|jgi:outer membrane protein assembly factor BamD|nr:outer membrane protein assembly factor BamD [Opitutales bacterium]MDP4883662.1 outer membrane protein assembly factor BamD [Opitutales bacterium]MDP5079093.1 outer membrane protein assembly factor BamD [Opitutales bacterium]
MAITLFMRHTFTYFFIILLSLTSTLCADFSLNPIKWFSDDEEPSNMWVASASDEAAATSMLEVGRQKLAAGNTGSANRTFKKIIKNYPTAKATGEALFLRARILMTRERWDKAFDSLQVIVYKHPNYKDFNQVIGSQFDCATAHMEGARGRIFWVFPGFRQYDRAMEEFEQIVNNAPYSDYAPLALMNIALVAEQEEEPEDAIDALDRLINYYPQSMLAPDAYYNLASTYSNLVKGSEYDQGSTRQAISYYEDFLVLFPTSNYTGEVESNLEGMENLLATSRLNLGDFYYLYRSNNTAALIFYNEAITIAPDSEAAQEATARIEDIEAGVRPINGATMLRKVFLMD